MLSYLSIRHLAIIKQLDIDFHTGFSALTGETGAGKSMLIDALNLTLGSRSDLSLIRQGEEKCDVSAIFDISNNIAAKTWLESQDIEPSECIIRRQLSINGNSKATVNGHPLGQKALQQFGNLLVNIHSQHAHYALLGQSTQRQLLDNYSHHQPLLEKLQDTYLAYQQCKNKYNQLKQLDSKEDKIALMRFQLEELNTFNPGENEYEELTQKHIQLSHNEAIKQDCAIALNALSGQQDGQANAQFLLELAFNSLRQYRENFPNVQRAIELLADAQTYLNEATDEIAHMQKSDEDENTIMGQLETIDQRLSRWHELARKHHIEPQDLYDFLLKLQQELAHLEKASLHLVELAKKMHFYQEKWQLVADELTQSRTQKALELQTAITHYLHQLHMYKARFEISVKTAKMSNKIMDNGFSEPTDHGQDTIVFMFSANADIETKELSKIASGGELSRVALAIAVANAQNATIPTLIFDEVDVGIGGATTEIVGQLLQQLGQSQQVFSITHQAQVASKANHHLHITKTLHNNQTTTSVLTLNPSQRIDEIARMIGGINLTDTTRQHAKEMLKEVS